MSEYTAEDFKNARFAFLSKYGLSAHRSAGEFYWQRDGSKRATNAEMAEAGWRPVREAAPLTLDTLREAWENAEQAGKCRKGDALIRRDDYGGYEVYRAALDSEIWNARILHRAPQPEPWQALADVLAAEMPGIEDEPHIEALAKALHCEHGVRVTGGDEA